jgi:YVTN family beta-propeller protein
VAHTGNDAVDIIDCAEGRYLFSIEGLTGVAGALVSEEMKYVFTSNRGEDAVGIIDLAYYDNVAKVKVGIRPNGLACDAGRGLLLAANVGNPDTPGSHTLSVVDVGRRQMIASIPVPGRTRWTVFDKGRDCFYVNIARPAQIAVVEAGDPTRVARTIEIPAEGPHGLDLDSSTGRLFCACDAGKLLAVDAATGKTLMRAELSGIPDVIFFNPARKHLYVAVGDPGVMDVFETDGLRRVEKIVTAKGAHTLGFDPAQNKIYVFEPETHSAAVYEDELS